MPENPITTSVPATGRSIELIAHKSGQAGLAPSGQVGLAPRGGQGGENPPGYTWLSQDEGLALIVALATMLAEARKVAGDA